MDLHCRPLKRIRLEASDSGGGMRFPCCARDQGDVWFFNKPVKNDLHPTMKPIELVERAVRNSSKSKDIVLDLFGGSGSTLIVCEKTVARRG